MTARLHVMLGEGGVGKTTLASAYALALARRGRKVGLLGIDPARRLQGALGLTLGEREVEVPLRGAAPGGALHAALLVPEAALRRWATAEAAEPEARERTLANSFFRILADHLATTTDVFAAVRLAEWLEVAPELDELVVDTAPGRNGLELFRRPDALVALLEGQLVRWLRRMGQRSLAHGSVEELGLATRVLGGLGRLGGMQVLVDLAELVAVMERPFARMLARLQRAQALLRAPETRLCLVAAVRSDAIPTTAVLAQALAEARLRPTAVVVNRTLPPSLGASLARLDAGALDPASAAVVRYAAAFVALQTEVVAAADALAPRVVPLPATRGLDADDRLEALAALGERLAAELAR